MMGVSVSDYIRGVEQLARIMNMRPPMLRRLRVRPLWMIELEIARATLPAMRQEDV